MSAYVRVKREKWNDLCFRLGRAEELLRMSSEANTIYARILHADKERRIEDEEDRHL